MPDFDITMEWQFSSWIPFVSRILPNDTVRLRKRGSSLRMDSTLLGMEGMSWARGKYANALQSMSTGQVTGYLSA